jgi:endoglucanase
MAYDIHPDSAIIVDVTFAEDLPDNMETMKIGKGPAIAVGAAINKEVYKKLTDIAKKENIDHQVEVLPMGTGTETDVVQMIKTGVKTGLLSIPIYNMHSPVEVVNENDIDLTAKLLALYAYEEGEQK